MNLEAIVNEILKEYALSPWGLHGVGHWARVLENGRRLAESTQANLEVVSLFAIFHDSRRENDGTDDGHGKRGAELAATYRGIFFDLPDHDFERLYRACEWHTSGRSDPDVTVQTCWDADRLDLGRVGIVPHPRYLCTAAAKTPAMIDWAYDRSISPIVPKFVSAEWRVPKSAWTE